MTTLDYIVIAAYLGAMAVVGLLASRGSRGTLEGYFVGGRSVHWLAGAASLVATSVSCRSLVGLPGLAFMGNLTYLQMYLVVPVVTIVVAFLFLPLYSDLQITSAYEYLGYRFGPGVRSFASILFQLETAFLLGTAVAAPSIVLSEASGISYKSSVAVLLAVTLLYTAIGGAKAVIWADVAQFVVFVSVLAVVIGYAFYVVPGRPGRLLALAAAHGKWRVFDFSFDLRRDVTFWAAITSIFLWQVYNYGASQTIVQRYMTAPSKSASRSALILSSFGSVVIWAVLLGTGTILYAANLLRPGVVHAAGHPDRVFVSFVMSNLPNGLKGAFIAAAFAAAMSALSSMLNSMGTVTVLDVWKLNTRSVADETTWLKRARWLTLMWGAFTFVFSLFVLNFGTVITAGIKLGGVVCGALLGMFLLGMFTRRASSRGVVAGAVVSLGMMVFVMATMKISWAWYCGIGTSMTVLFGYTFSLFSPTSHESEKYVHPILKSQRMGAS